MNLIISNFVSIIVFSLIFFLLPIRMNNRNKNLMLFLSIACFILGQITLFLFSWWLAVLVILLFILCVTILVGGKVLWLEKDKRDNHEQSVIHNNLPQPLFSYEQLKKNSAHGTDLDFSAVRQVHYLRRDTTMDIEESKYEEIAETIDSMQMDHLTKLDDTVETILQKNQIEVPLFYEHELEIKAGASQITENKAIVEDEYDADIQQIFKSRFRLLEDNEKLGSSNLNIQENVDEQEQPRKLDDLQMDDMVKDSKEDLQLLYEKLKKNRERG
jgi:hypothetical protein